MKVTKVIILMVLMLSGCTKYEPFIAPSTHPANLEIEKQAPPWKGPNALTVSPEIENDAVNEATVGSAHNHMHMQMQGEH